MTVLTHVSATLSRLRQDRLSKCIRRDGIRRPPIWNGWVCRRPSERWTLCFAKIGCSLRARALLWRCEWKLVFGVWRWKWRRRRSLRASIIRRKLSQCKSSITHDATDITRALWHVPAHGRAAYEHHATAIASNELISRRQHQRPHDNISWSGTNQPSPL